MTGQRIDGIEVSNAVKEILSRAVTHIKSEGLMPCLATVLIGDDPASATYVKNKH
ncbi:MAG TPA: tetrahydrofolate dehydrogenase/cyclohydrolase catalytic domain-containing protein, partial [Candidatus Nitrosopelagicus sp.]|nr:tetrahydrofolate dehydrogenase/cyclohydrolase catalytic domain-containing protein [Candidatus Nitrosopelagicus sp.]